MCWMVVAHADRCGYKRAPGLCTMMHHTVTAMGTTCDPRHTPPAPQILPTAPSHVPCLLHTTWDHTFPAPPHRSMLCPC